MYVRVDQAFTRLARGFLGGLGQALFTQPGFGAFLIPVRFCESRLTFHDTGAGFLTQLFYQIRWNSHELPTFPINGGLFKCGWRAACGSKFRPPVRNPQSAIRNNKVAMTP